MTMFPRMIEVIVRIIAARVVTDPSIAVGMHVRRCGTSRPIAYARGGMRVTRTSGRTVRRYVPTPDGRPGMAAAAWMLSQCAEGN